MKILFNSLFLCVLTVSASFANVANDYLEPVTAPRPVSDYDQSIAGKAYMGYQTRYQYKNIVASRYLNSSGVFNLGGEVDLPLLSWEQHITADYGYALDGELNDRNMFNVSWFADREVLPNLKTGGGYNMNYGGMPGFIAKMKGKAPHSLAQSIDGFISYDDSGRGIFGSLDVQGGFYGLTGWRFDVEVGKRWSGVPSSYMDLELSGGMGFSTSYWGSGVDGVDQMNLKLAAPIRTSLTSEKNGLRITPFIQAVWAGNTRGDINRSCGFRAVDKFEMVGGIGVSYCF